MPSTISDQLRGRSTPAWTPPVPWLAVAERATIDLPTQAALTVDGFIDILTTAYPTPQWWIRIADLANKPQATLVAVAWTDSSFLAARLVSITRASLDRFDPATPDEAVEHRRVDIQLVTDPIVSVNSELTRSREAWVVTSNGTKISVPLVYLDTQLIKRFPRARRPY